MSPGTKCNKTSKKEENRTFIISFDNGGIPSRSLYKPVFVLVNELGSHNFFTTFVCSNERMNLEYANSKKEAVNAIVSTSLCKDPDGFRDLYKDNSNSEPELFVMLKMQYNIIACGTIFTSRTEWDQLIMNHPKLSSKSESNFTLSVEGQQGSVFHIYFMACE